MWKLPKCTIHRVGPPFLDLLHNLYLANSWKAILSREQGCYKLERMECQTLLGTTTAYTMYIYNDIIIVHHYRTFLDKRMRMTVEYLLYKYEMVFSQEYNLIIRFFRQQTTYSMEVSQTIARYSTLPT